eukprot:IDg8536t1
MHRVHQCPRVLEHNIKEILCRKSSRFSNLYRHFIRCYKSTSDLYVAVRDHQNLFAHRKAQLPPRTIFFP